MRFSLILILFFSFSSFAKYQRGYRACSDKSEEYYKQDSENIEYQYLYASCLVIKGEDSKGLPQLYLLADHNSSLTANFFLADYLWTDGRFENLITEKNLNEAIHYYLRTQAIIDLIPNYPEPNYFFHEKSHQMELKAIYRVPYLYLTKYNLGIIGNYRIHQLQSPSYQGNRNKETYPEYNTLMWDSLDKAHRFAKQCASLPQKRHFDSIFYKATIEACDLLKDLVASLIPLEEKRQEILLQSHCKDLNETNCPEYYDTHTEAYDLITNYVEVAENIFNSVVGVQTSSASQ